MLGRVCVAKTGLWRVMCNSGSDLMQFKGAISYFVPGCRIILNFHNAITTLYRFGGMVNLTHLILHLLLVTCFS